MSKLSVTRTYLVALTMAIAAASSMASAATLYWDANGSSSGLGGDGTWQDGQGNWSTDTAGTLSTTWTNSSANVADFRGTAGSVTVSGTVTASQIAFNSGAYTLTGDGINLQAASGSSTLINYNAGSGNISIGNTIALDDTANAASAVTYTLQNKSNDRLSFAQAINVINSTSGVKTLALTNTSASGVIVTNGFGNVSGTASLILSVSKGYVQLNGDGGNAKLVVTGATSTNTSTALLGHNNAAGTGTITFGSSGAHGALSVLTNGAVTISNAMNLSGAADSVAYVGGNTADDSTFSGSFLMNAFTTTPDPHFTAVAGGRVNFSGNLNNSSGSNRGVVKDGAGVVAFSYAPGNGYKGYTRINQGTLLLMNTSGSATGLGTYVTAGDAGVTISSGAGLGGTGITTQLVGALDAASIITPGDMTKGGTSSIGTLHLAGGLTAASGATFNFDINGSQSDAIAFGSSAVTVGGVLTFNFKNLGTVDTDTIYTLATGTGTWTGTPDSIAVNLIGFDPGVTVDTSYGANGVLWDGASDTVTVKFTAASVPEVASLSLLSIGALALMLRPKRHA